MKKLLIGFGMLVLVLGMAGGANAGLIVTSGGVTPGDGSYLTSQYAGTAGFTLVDFNSGLPGNGVVNNAGLATGTVSGEHAKPLNDGTQYLTVPVSQPTSPGSFTLNLGSSANYLGLYWGSIDWLNGGAQSSTYNRIELFNGQASVGIVSGLDLSTWNIATGTSGDQNAAGTNLYINISGIDFDKIVFSANQKAFEFDNVVYGAAVPEPATMLTLGLGLLGLAGLKRKFKL